MLGCYNRSLGNHLVRKWAHGVCVHACVCVCVHALGCNKAGLCVCFSSPSFFGGCLCEKNLLEPDLNFYWNDEMLLAVV